MAESPTPIPKLTEVLALLLTEARRHAVASSNGGGRGQGVEECVGSGATSPMTALTLLRAVAFVMAGVGSWIPRVSCSARRRLRLSPSRPDDALRRTRSFANSRGPRTLIPPLKPSAVVLAGGDIDVDSIPAGIPVSTVRIGEVGPNVSVIGFVLLPSCDRGWSAAVQVPVRGRGMAGKTHGRRARRTGCRACLRSTFLEARRRERGAWADVCAGRGWSAGASGDRAPCSTGESATDDNQFVSTVNVAGPPAQSARARAAAVLDGGLRPACAGRGSGFQVAALARVLEGTRSSCGPATASISAEAIASFDAVVVGAPEELQAREVDALETFARRRGGLVVYLPDRRPSGALRQPFAKQRFRQNRCFRIHRGLPWRQARRCEVRSFSSPAVRRPDWIRWPRSIRADPLARSLSRGPQAPVASSSPARSTPGGIGQGRTGTLNSGGRRSEPGRWRLRRRVEVTLDRGAVRARRDGRHPRACSCHRVR